MFRRRTWVDRLRTVSALAVTALSLALAPSFAQATPPADEVPNGPSSRPTTSPALDPNQFYLRQLYTPEQYRQNSTFAAWQAMMRSDADVLNKWHAYLKQKQAELDRIHEVFAQRAAEEKRAREQFARARELQITRLNEQAAREQTLAAAEASSSAANFRERTAGIRRIGIVNDNGYFYRFYDDDGQLRRTVVTREREDVDAARVSLQLENDRLTKWSSAIEAYNAQSWQAYREQQVAERAAALQQSWQQQQSKVQVQKQIADVYQKAVDKFNQEQAAARAAASVSGGRMATDSELRSWYEDAMRRAPRKRGGGH